MRNRCVAGQRQPGRSWFRVLGRFARCGYSHGDRFADVARLLERQQVVGAFEDGAVCAGQFEIEAGRWQGVVGDGPKLVAVAVLTGDDADCAG